MLTLLKEFCQGTMYVAGILFFFLIIIGFLKGMFK